MTLPGKGKFTIKNEKRGIGGGGGVPSTLVALRLSFYGAAPFVALRPLYVCRSVGTCTTTLGTLV